MDMATVALVAIAVVFGGCLVVIAVCDLCSYTIPNSVSVALLVLFVVAAPFSGAEVSPLSHFYSFLVVFAVGLIAYRFGVFGGGDIKSWTAVALWYDLHDLPAQVLWVTLIGGGLGVLVLGLRYLAASQFVQHLPTRFHGPRLLRMGEPIPYGVAIAAGTFLTVSHIDIFHSLRF